MTSRRSVAGLALLVLVVGVVVVVARRAAPESPARTVALSSWPSALALDAHTGRAVITAGDVRRHTAQVTVLDTASGTIVQTVSLHADPAGVAVDARTERAFVTGNVAATGGHVDVLDLRSGRVLSAVAVHRDPAGRPDAVALVAQVDEQTGRAFVLSYLPDSGFRGLVSTLDATSGRPLRTVPVGPRPAALVVSAHTGRVFVANADGVSVLDARSGTVVRTIPLTMTPAALAVDERRGRIFVATAPSGGGADASSGLGGVTVLNATTGDIVATVPLSSTPSAVAVDEATGHVFVAQGGGVSGAGETPGAVRVSVLDARRGTVVRTVALGQSPVLLAVDGRRSRVYVATRDTTADTPVATGSVLALDARTGTVLHTMLRGVAPIAVGVDDRGGQVVVVSYGGWVSVPDAWAWVPAWARRRLPFLPAAGPPARPVPGTVRLLDASR